MKHFTPLSKVQIIQLCALATQAFKAAQARGGVEDGMTAEQYRRDGQLEAAGIASLKDARQNHFLEIRGKWWTVIGNLEAAFYDFLNAGTANESRRQMAWRLAGQISFLADAMQFKHFKETGIELSEGECARQAWAYATSIARVQHGVSIGSLDARQLENLGFTIVNRTTAMRGRGDSRNRNKSQRLKRPSKPAESPVEDGARRSKPAPFGDESAAPQRWHLAEAGD